MLFPGRPRILPAQAGVRVLAGVLAVMLGVPAASAAPDPKKVMGPASCAECHPNEVEAWKTTAHFKSFHGLQRRPEMAPMLAKLGLANAKTEASCRECHFLGKEVEGTVQATAAISCESCHGGGRDWIQTHGDYGRGVKRDDETPEHRASRRAEAVSQGMIDAHNLYGLGSACYRCHVVTDEKLVNVAGHSAGSVGFELLAWSQGEIRHNVLHPEQKGNPEAPLTIRRQLFVVGWLLEMEFSLRAVSRATEKAGYGIGYAKRADAARKMLEKIQTLAPTPQLEAILKIARPVALRLNNGAELAAAAERIAALAREFTTHVPGEKLAAVDSLLPGADRYKGTPYSLTTP